MKYINKLRPFVFALLWVHTLNRLFAVDIPAGTYYFDNSKTEWTSVQFLYGTDNPQRYTFVDLVDKGAGKWELTIPVTEKNMYRYSFCQTSFPAETFTDKSFTSKKDELSSAGYLRTATTDAYIPQGTSANQVTFVPETGDNWAQGQWTVNLSPTGTLPVFYLHTENAAEIVSKDYYLNATIFIDAQGIPGYTSTGTVQNPVITEVKGRGNYTWTGFDKKPYRIKMDKKAQLLNMTSDKSYNLMARADDATFLRDEMGFELSRRLGFAYTAANVPVELVVNGDYRGLYFLTEHIKVSAERVNIQEQNDNETNPSLITGGWLIEIDNYDDVNQVSTSRVPRFTCKSPEMMSSQQENYIRTFLQNTENAIYTPDKNSVEWEKYIDLETLVDFYIVQEIMGNTESFHGSCYFTKERGENTKILFGPVWDFGNAYRHGHKFIYVDPQFTQHWIPEMAKFHRFQARLVERWAEIRNTQLPAIYDYIDQFAAKIEEAVKNDYARWPQYGSSVYANDLKTVKDYLSDRIAWLDMQWNKSSSINQVTEDEIKIYTSFSSSYIYIEAPEIIREVRLFDLLGKWIETYANVQNRLKIEAPSGTYIVQVVTPSLSKSKIIGIK